MSATLPFTQPQFRKEINQLAKVMRTKSPDELKELMKISDKVAALNVERYRQIKAPIPLEIGKPALFLFAGDAYQGLDAESLNEEDITFAQEHLRILSGLYGILRPLDLMLPYRLEMGTRLVGKDFNTLYEYWGNKLTKNIKSLLSSSNEKGIINLASKEYFSALDFDAISAPVYTMHFKEYKNGTYKFITYYGKKARGLMTRFIIKNKLITPEEVKYFDLDGYHFNPELSGEFDWVFTRGDE